MSGIRLERGGACVYQDNDEKIDPDNDFADIVRCSLGLNNCGFYSHRNFAPSFVLILAFLFVDQCVCVYF